MDSGLPLKIALIGNGSIATVVAHHCEGAPDRLHIVGALGLPEDLTSVGQHPLVQDLAALLAEMPDLVVECAAQEAAQVHGTAVLDAGVDLMVISVGAFADPILHDRLETAAVRGKAKIIIPAGALAGLDALGAAALDTLDHVSLTTRKPPPSWSGAPGVADIDLLALKGATTIFEGTAREAARQFPKNANVAAALALSGVGMDATQVTLIADPQASRNTHQVEARGAFGRLSATIEAEPSPDNPKTSYIAALSIVRMLDRLTARIAN